MGRRKDIGNATRKEIVNQKRIGVNNIRISHLFDWSVRTVHNIWRRYRESHVTNKRSRSGRQRATTALDDRRLILRSRQLRFSTLDQLRADWTHFLGREVILLVSEHDAHCASCEIK